MALLNQSVQVYGKLGELFQKLREGQAPAKFTREFLGDLGFKSSNWHAAIGLLKGLGFLSSDGAPTPRYMEFLDETRWKQVLARAVKEAYRDIFVMKRHPTKSDTKMIAGKFKSTYNLSDTAADRNARTFLALLKLSDEQTILEDQDPATAASQSKTTVSEEITEPEKLAPETKPTPAAKTATSVGLNYNIQIHLPASKDIEVYNAIFKSLKEHIID